VYAENAGSRSIDCQQSTWLGDRFGATRTCSNAKILALTWLRQVTSCELRLMRQAARVCFKPSSQRPVFAVWRCERVHDEFRGHVKGHGCARCSTMGVNPHGA
jgi:transposase InsO family protein